MGKEECGKIEVLFEEVKSLREEWKSAGTFSYGMDKDKNQQDWWKLKTRFRLLYEIHLRKLKKVDVEKMTNDAKKGNHGNLWISQNVKKGKQEQTIKMQEDTKQIPD